MSNEVVSSIQQKIEKKTSRKDKKEKVCSICGLPGMVTYQYLDIETSRVETNTHWCPCLGHDHIITRLQNLHPDYDRYQAYKKRVQKRAGGHPAE